jgi:hypothetical protein
MGREPESRAIRNSAGDLYGTNAFKLDPAGNLTVLHTFTGGAPGKAPEGTLTRDRAGTIHGTTFIGGIHKNGIVKNGIVFDLKMLPQQNSWVDSGSGSLPRL